MNIPGSSDRSIPIHPALIELGFLSYADAIKSRGHTHVFPNLPHKQGGKRGNLVSRSFISQFREHGVQHPETGLNTFSLVTHSLRHCFRVAGFKVPEQEFVQVVMGHYVGGVSFQTYGPQIYHMPEVLADRVMNVRGGPTFLTSHQQK
jgi:integrase